ncbi:MAG: hypothetical protein ACJA2S_005377 [Cyclobacteriaceae bacterium]|jgi:hypothetical protein
MKMQLEFVDNIPEDLEEHIIYLSIKYSTAVHKCVCGCGNEVVTPITPTDWSFKYNGESISLSPSIGNWSFNCKSHYWIRRSKVVHCPKWDSDEIEFGRKKDKKKKWKFFRKKK